MHAIETCGILCLQVMMTFANHVGLLHFLMCKSDSNGFFQPQLVVCHHHKRLQRMHSMLHRDKGPLDTSDNLLHGTEAKLVHAIAHAQYATQEQRLMYSYLVDNIHLISSSVNH